MRFGKSLLELTKEDLVLAGGKGANLGELTHLKVAIPKGYLLPTYTFDFFLEKKKLTPWLEKKLADISPLNNRVINETATELEKHLQESPLPKEILEELKEIYHELVGNSEARLACRSSGLHEDSQVASFAGILLTNLGIKSLRGLNKAVKKCWASAFSRETLTYILQAGLTPLDIKIAIVIQRMVQAKASGVLFTVNPTTGDQSNLIIDACYGFGEGVVSGKITPDLYVIDREKLAIISKKVTTQKESFTATGKIRSIPKKEQTKQKISDEDIILLAKQGLKIEKHFGSPQDIEWAKDSDDKIYFLQSRPIISATVSDGAETDLATEEIVILRGIGISPRVGWGKVVLPEEKDLDSDFLQDKVIVLPRLTQDLAVKLKIAAGVVANEGGVTSHGANILREFHIPCVVGTRYGTEVLHKDDLVTVDGWRGLVLDGVSASQKEILVQKRKTKTKVMVSLSVPETAFQVSGLADGVSSLRNDYLLLKSGVHPHLLLKKGQQKHLQDLIVEAIHVVAEAFGGKPLWYKTLDAPTDEFRRLIGGEDEPLERNPLLGWRGIARELEELELLKMEYTAVKEVIKGDGINLGIKIPLLRSVEEYKKAKEVARSVGLNPHEDVAFGISIETPAVALNLDDYVQCGVDFFSIGMNDLTMCTLAIDRESERISPQFNVSHPAVLKLLRGIAEVANKREIFSCLCGEVTKEKLLRSLVNMGFDAVGVSPPFLPQVRSIIASEES